MGRGWIGRAASVGLKVLRKRRRLGASACVDRGSARYELMQAHLVDYRAIDL